MLLKMFAIQDVTVNAFMAPFFMVSEGQAKRAFAEACQGKDNNFSKYPADFSLYCLGEFNDESGFVRACATPLFIARASEFVKVD